ncbi:hypothetical protein WMY93_033351 [Mugilogobius chulae]|uniref:HEAT repeat-containing protein 1 n=1 Tax=Mugilogobius chulae TaxID=88201 RepID=A0AAW0MIA1_9GOBI
MRDAATNWIHGSCSGSLAWRHFLFPGAWFRVSHVNLWKKPQNKIRMTSLSLQLKRLALPQTDPNLFTRKEVASLLFDPKDAATMDRSTFYALGLCQMPSLSLSNQNALGLCQMPSLSLCVQSERSGFVSDALPLSLCPIRTLWVCVRCPPSLCVQSERSGFVSDALPLSVSNQNALGLCQMPSLCLCQSERSGAFVVRILVMLGPTCDPDSCRSRRTELLPPHGDVNLTNLQRVDRAALAPRSLTVNQGYSNSCTGLEELQGIEPSLSHFHNTLFSSSSVTLERSVQTKDTNLKLDQDISLFLRRLSPYFLLKPAHKCLEWLIHRFHIHLYNVDSLLACVLPFYDSKVFVRVLQLLKIQEPTHKWNWLHCLQKPGVPLSRLTLVTHCYKDLGFMDFICNMVSSSIQAFSDVGGGVSQLRVVFSFFASTIVSALDSTETVTDAMITKLLPHVQKGLKSSLLDFRASSLMIVCQLSVKVTLEKVLVQSLSGLLCKSLKDRVLVRETLGALIVLLQNQDHAGPTHKALSRLVSASDVVVSSLESMAQTHDVSALLRHLLPHLLSCSFSSDSAEACSAAELDLELSLITCVCPQAAAGPVSVQDQSQDQDQDLDHRLVPVLRLLETKYSWSMDRALSSRVSDLSEEQKPLFHQLLSLSSTCGKFQLVSDSDSSLLLSLNHPQATVRVLALDKLRETIGSGQGASVDPDFLKSSVFDRLRDDEASVVAKALELLKLVLSSLDPEDTVSALLSLLHRAEDSYSQDWCPVLSEAVSLLATPALGQSDSDRLLFRLLPFLVPSGSHDSVRFSLAFSLSQSRVIQQHRLTTGWRADLEEALQSSPDPGPDQVLVLIQTLISTVSRNIQNMETFTRRQTCDSLCSCVEVLSESGSEQDQTPLLVLIQVLVLKVLERHLQESAKDSQQVPVPAPGPALFSDWLALYLRRGDGQLELGLVLVSFCPSSSKISRVRTRPSKVKDSNAEWWNPERLDTNTCCYLQLLSQVFCLLMGGASDGQSQRSTDER